MNLRAKVYDEKQNMVFTVLSVDMVDRKVEVKIEKGSKYYNFKDLKWLEATEFKADKLRIYRDDFILATKDKETLSGIVVKYKGLWYLKNKKREIFVSLNELVGNSYKFINLKNSKIYFARKREKENK